MEISLGLELLTLVVQDEETCRQLVEVIRLFPGKNDYPVQILSHYAAKKPADTLSYPDSPDVQPLLQHVSIKPEHASAEMTGVLGV